MHDALLALEAERNARLRQPLFDRYRLPFALSIGRVSAGDWPSSVPDLLVCEGRYGIAPGEDVGAAQRAFESADRRRRHARIRFSPTIRRASNGGAASSCPRRRRTMPRSSTTARAAIADVTGAPPRVEGMTYGADMRLLVNDGGIPTVLFGPGNVRRAHRPDECVPIDDLMIVARDAAR